MIFFVIFVLLLLNNSIMKKIISLVVVFATIFTVSFAQGDSKWYDSMWKGVNINTNAPSTNLIKVNEIYAKSIEDSNEFQRLKAFRYIIDLNSNIDWKRCRPLVDSLDGMRGSFKDKNINALYEVLRTIYINRYITGGHHSASNRREEYETLKPSVWNHHELQDWNRKQVDKIKHSLSYLEKLDVESYYTAIDNNRLGEETLSYIHGIRSPNMSIESLRRLRAVSSVFYDLLESESKEKCLAIYLAEIISHYQNDYDSLIDSYSDKEEVMILYNLQLHREMRNSSAQHAKEHNYYEKLAEKYQNILEKSPDNIYINILITKIKELYQKSARISVNKQVYPNKDLELKLTHKNIDKLWFEVCAITPNNDRDSIRLLTRKRVNLESPLYHTITTMVEIKAPAEYGNYLLVVRDESENIMVVENFAVSEIGALYRSTKDGFSGYFADYYSGKPYPSIDVNFIDYKKGSNDKVAFDLDGFTDIKKIDKSESYIYVFPSAGDDKYSPPTILRHYYIPDIDTIRAAIYTDRLRYNPNDTIHYKVVLHTNGSKAKPITNRDISIELFSNNGNKNLFTHSKQTDSWGACSGYFVTNSNITLGAYYIDAKLDSMSYGSSYIHIEEYKIPSFEIELESTKPVNVWGEKAVVEGVIKSFGGYNVDNAKITYTVKRAYLETLKKGTVECNDKGEFEIDFIPTIKDDERYRNRSFIVEVTVTDISGETVFQRHNIQFSDYSQSIITNFKSRMIHKELNPKLNICISDGKNMLDGVVGNYTISKKHKKRERKVLFGEFISQEPVTIMWDKLPSGEYSIEYTSELSDTVKHNFTLFSIDDKHSPNDDKYFVYPLRDTFSVAAPIEFILDAKADKIYAVVEIVKLDDSKHHSEIVELDGEMRKITINPQLEEDCVLRVTVIHDCDYYTYAKRIKFKNENEKLDMKFISLRDKNRPAGEEKFTIRVTNHDGSPASANIVLTAFNKASVVPYYFNYHQLRLDKFSYPVKSIVSEAFRDNYLHFDIVNREKDIRSVFLNRIRSETIVGSMTTVGFGGLPTGAANSEIILNDEIVMSKFESANPEIRAALSIPEVKERTDFRNTAAFMPNLITDSNGEVEVKFSYPDAITTYTIMAMAYDRSIASTVTSKEVVVTKDVMVMSQLPEFLRGGDKIKIKLQAFNKTDKEIEATLTISSDDCKFEGKSKKRLTLKPNSSEMVECTINVPDNVDEITLRSELDSENHTDIEVKTIPVVPAVALYSKSQSMIINGKRSINLASYIQERGSEQKLTINALDPKTMLVVSLPYLVTDDSKSITTTLAKWQTLAVSRVIAGSYRDKINGWFDDYQPNPMASNSVMIDETPWRVVNKEKAQQQLLWLANNKKDDVVLEIINHQEQIASYQNHDGGFGWFKGMESSYYLTMHMLESLITLKKIGYYINLQMPISSKAIDYIDNYINRNIENWTKGDNYNYFGLLRYLYIRSAYINDYKPSETTKKSIDSAIEFVNNYPKWGNAIITNTMRATALNRLGGYDDIVNNLISEIKEYVAINPEGGRYFPNAVMPYRGMIYSELWAHTMILNLLQELPENSSNQKLENDLAIWLMLQRKNQSWSGEVSSVATTIATLWEHYDDKKYSNIAKTTINKKYIVSEGVISGVSLNVNKLRANPAPVTIEGNNIFVDIIYTCEKPLSEVKPESNGFKISRELYLVKDSVDIPITEDTMLHLGDRVVARYYIESSDNRSLVTLKTLRSGALQPLDNRSRNYRGYYREVRKSQTNYYFYLLPEHITTVEEHFYVSYSGRFSDGYLRIESIFSPAYNANTDSDIINVK